MPTYEYRCPDGHDFEQFTLKISNAQSELPCPTCGKAAPRRISAGGGLLFKGSGFYITDYGKDGKKDQRAAKSTATSASAATAPASGTASGTASAGSGSAPAAPAAAPSTPAPKSSGE